MTRHRPRMGRLICLDLLACGFAFLGCTAAGRGVQESPAVSYVADQATTIPDSAATREAKPPVRSQGKVSDRFPNTLLYTHDNQTVRFYDDLVKDRTVIIQFMYTRCTGT